MSGVGKRRGEGRERERGERTYLLSSNIFEDHILLKGVIF